MRGVLIVAAVCVCFAAVVSGHAHLTEPLAWNPNPSKSSPCGAGAAFPTYDTTSANAAVGPTSWTPNKNLQFQWQLVAGDGAGMVSIAIDENYGTSFQSAGTAQIVSGPSTDGNIDVLGYYVLSFTPPASLLCSGGATKNLCSVQFTTPSGWYSCTTITSSNAIATASNYTAPPETCVAGHGGQNMFFCTNSNQGNFAITQSVFVAGSPNLQGPLGFTNTDKACNATFYQNMNSALVFTNSKLSTGGWNPACATAYRRYLCAQNFPLCSGTQQSGVEACKSICYAAIDACGLAPSHQNLFDCATDMNFPNSNNENAQDSVGQCPPCTGVCALTLPASASTSSLSVATLLAIVVAFFAL